jgi:two-component system sensor histidine kinase KdpD
LDFFRGTLRGVVFSLLLVALVTATLFGLIEITGVAHATILYLIAVVVAAVRWNIVAALAVGAAGVAASAFFFYPPIYSLRVSNPQEVFELSLFVFAAIVTAQLASRAKRQAEIATQRENQVRALYSFSRQLAMAFEPADIQKAIQDHLAAVTGRRVVLLGAEPGRGTSADAKPSDIPEPVRAAAERMMTGRPNQAFTTVVEEAGGALWLVRPLLPQEPFYGVIAVDLGHDSSDDNLAMRVQVETVLADAAATLEHLGIAGAMSEAKVRAETELLREALIGSVSHELRTPLASILGAATVLQNAPAVSADRRLKELAQVIREDADRLNNDIQNLLNASRISSHGIEPRLESTDPADIVNSALDRCRRRLSDHPVTLDLPDELPLVMVDSVLVEQAMVQILDNAAKYSPKGSTIRIAATARDAVLTIRITDAGSGLISAEKDRMWQRFFRGERHATAIPGSGLGLWIANAFVAAVGGKLGAESAGADRGTTITLDLPVAHGKMPESVLASGEDNE